MVQKRQKSFSYSWGSGHVAKEAQVTGQYHLPTLQLLEYTEGEAAGDVSIRFCHYGHNGGFRRSPLLMSAGEVDMMREALATTPKLRQLLSRLLDA